MNRRRTLSALVVPVLLLAVLTPSCRERRPFSYDFEQPVVLDDLVWKCRALYRLSPEHSTSGARSLAVTFFPAPPEERENYPGVAFAGFDRDWSARRTLAFDVFNPDAVALSLTLRIDDRRGPKYTERLNRTLTIEPGANHVSIPLAGLATSGSRRPLDLTNILRVLLFMANPRERHTLYFDGFTLE